MMHRSSKISRKKVWTLVRRFARGYTATDAAKEAKVSRNTANLYYNHFRESLANNYNKAPRFDGEVEMDQSFFGKGIKRRTFDARKNRRSDEEWRAKGDPIHWTKRKRRETKNILVFGILKREGDVYTKIIDRADRNTLFPIIHMVVKGGSTVYTDRWQGFNALRIDGYEHRPVNHAEGPVGRDGAHTGSIDSFWGFAKTHLRRFRGISRRTFALHLKECEFRWNHRGEEEMIKILRKIT